MLLRFLPGDEPDYEEFVNARGVGSISDFKGRFVWDAGVHQYRYKSNGRLVASSIIDNAIRRVMQGYQQQMQNLTLRFQAGKIDLQTWYDRMTQLLVKSYRAAVAAKGGGFRNADWTQAGLMMQKQLEYLARFAEGLKTGQVALDGRAVVRAGMYAKGSGEIASNYGLLEALQMGFTEARRVLHPAEHCSDCVDYADQGWMPIVEMPPIGASKCDGNCQCSIEFQGQSDLVGDDPARAAAISALLGSTEAIGL